MSKEYLNKQSLGGKNTGQSYSRKRYSGEGYSGEGYTREGYSRERISGDGNAGETATGHGPFSAGHRSYEARPRADKGGAEWWPLCQKEIIELEQEIAAVQELLLALEQATYPSANRKRYLIECSLEEHRRCLRDLQIRNDRMNRADYSSH